MSSVDSSLGRRPEWVVAIALTTILAALHVTFLLSAGGLWRDEVHSVNVATLPSLVEIWNHMHFDSFPMLWFLLLHGWTAIVSPTSDFAIRILGFLIGTAIVAALWRNARVLGYGFPLLSLVLFGLNAAVIAHGDAIRGHGLGMASGLLAFGFFWQLTDEPGVRSATWAALAALLAVHSLYYNVAFVLAACCGAAAVAISKKSVRALGFIAGVGALSAVSILPYALLFRKTREWDVVIRVPVDLPWIWFKVQEAFASSGPLTLWVWLAVLALAVAATVYVFLPSVRSRIPERGRHAALYSVVAATAGAFAYLLFLRRLGYVTQPWYYVGLMAIVAAGYDAPLSLLASTLPARSIRLGLVLTAAALLIPFTWTAARTRKTNVDLVAAKVNGLVASGDLVVVNPWYVGLTYNRYSIPSAEWTTIPPISNHVFHREDLIKEKLMSRHAIQPVLERMKQALQNGHRVFWVGDLFLPEPGTVPLDPPPAPHPQTGWSDAPYYEAWGLQAGYLIQSKAKAAEKIEVPVPQPVNPYEDVALYMFNGSWELR